ncbi:hypothetical protein [Thermococcus thioreducens]|uniref:Uncharacterized protein n=2 Tax=Thermococcus thioreducens TaxID=277988 RepID=A0A1I0NRG8_9EURY|nr:hypothetical protein [Thermococcus thioreducens]SEW04036.1 hypothetical protein SAMN05216170_1197 [Thermococcus thioreducens]
MTMQKPMVDYKWSLLMLAELYGSDEFDSKTVSEDLTLIMFNLTSDPKWIERLQPKLVSNDLRWLYTMGFLRRRKVERKCRNRKGREYNCGYKYMYQINNQGWKYIGFLLQEFMKRDAPLSKQVLNEFREFNEDLENMRIATWKWMAVKYFEEGKLKEAKLFLDTANESMEGKFERKGYMRFAESRRIYAVVMRHRVREVELINMINSLRKELKQKDETIERLQEGLERCREMLTELSGHDIF